MAVDRKRIYHKRDRLRQLRAFCEAARIGSFARAAQSLCVSPPSVSLHVRELENELEALLFDRSGPGISLTRAGQRLLKHAEPMVQGLDKVSVDLVEQLEDPVPERLRIAASAVGAACVLPSHVRRFRELYPEVRLRVSNRPLHECLELLRNDEVELVLGAKDPGHEDTARYHHVAAYDVVLITAVDHPLAGRETVSPQEAAAWPAIVPPEGTYSREFGETAARQYGIDVRTAIEVGGWGVIKRCVENGLGISLVPSISIMETDRLATIPLTEYFPTRSYGVYTPRGKHVTLSTRRLLRLMVPNFADSLPPPGRTGGVGALSGPRAPGPGPRAR